MLSTQTEILTRRVSKVLPSNEALLSRMDQKLRVYQGFDPTGGRLHLGHAIGLKKLMEFANLGHEVIFLFGTGTVLVGDPSLRDSKRKEITQEEIQTNIQGWKDQVSPIVDFDKVNIRFNAEWLLKMDLKDIISLASHISAVQLFKRESFNRRIEAGDTVWYHETMYPLLQGYDSVVMDVDVEVGGTDQEFNMLIGRELQKKMRDRNKIVLTVPMIMGTDGKQMSKSSGNCIWLDDEPHDMYGKVMSLLDEQIIPYFELVTDVPLEKVTEIATALKQGKLAAINAKKSLAHQLVLEFHNLEAANQAQSFFESTIQQRQLPTDIELISVHKGKHSILELCRLAKPSDSSSQIKRLIQQGGVSYNGQKITDISKEIEISEHDVIQYGKRTFRKLAVIT